MASEPTSREMNETAMAPPSLDLRYLLIELVSEVVTVIDSDGILTYCSPSITSQLGWDPAEVMALGSAPTNWMMEPTYRCEAVEPGDPVYLWVTGQPGADPTPGVWAAGHVTTPPDPAPDWRSQHARRDQAVYVHVDIDFLDEPIPREQLAKDSRFANSEILCVPRTNSPVKLTASEIEAIEQARQSDGRS